MKKLLNYVIKIGRYLFCIAVNMVIVYKSRGVHKNGVSNVKELSDVFQGRQYFVMYIAE